MAEQTTKRKRLRKTVQEFYALQSPTFRSDAESWMKHIHAVYGYPGNGMTADIQKRRADKRRTVQSSDEELSIGKKSTLAQEGTGSSSDEDTSSLRPNPKWKRLRLEREERCQLSVAASLPCEESLTPLAAKTVGAQVFRIISFLLVRTNPSRIRIATKD
jgi:hypothetical protein